LVPVNDVGILLAGCSHQACSGFVTNCFFTETWFLLLLALPCPSLTALLQGGEKGGTARKEQMAEENGGDASAGYAEMGQKGGQA
jgi:hypothetical protein